MLTLICFSLLIRFALIFVLPIHWDEFHFLSRVYEFERGELTKPLQTLHVHFFAWLSQPALLEDSTVRIGRVCIYLLNCCSLFLLYRLAGAGFKALCTVLLALSFLEGYVHSSAFRYDPLILFCVLLSLALSKRVLFSGMFFGLSALISLKSLLFFPLLALTDQENQQGAKLKRLITFSSAAGLSGLTLLLLHLMSLSEPDGAQDLSVISRSALGVAFIPGLESEIVKSLLSNFLPWSLLIAGFVIALTKKEERLEALLLWSPFFLSLFYRNAFLYFFPCIIPLLCLGSKGYFERLTRRVSKRVQAVLLLALFLLPLVQVLPELSRFISYSERQTQALGLLHELFPETVSYMDRGGMLASFPRVGPFVSRWGKERYQPGSLKVVLEKSQPEFLILNHPGLYSACGLSGSEDFYHGADLLALQERFMQLSGGLCVERSRYEELRPKLSGREFPHDLFPY